MIFVLLDDCWEKIFQKIRINCRDINYWPKVTQRIITPSHRGLENLTKPQIFENSFAYYYYYYYYYYCYYYYFLIFLFLFDVSGSIFRKFLPRSESCERRLSWKFRVNSLKIGTLVSVFPFINSRFVYYSDSTMIFITYDLRDITWLWKKD